MNKGRISDNGPGVRKGDQVTSLESNIEWSNTSNDIPRSQHVDKFELNFKEPVLLSRTLKK